ncbi:hypothetical protein [Tenacibaculum agarivorans]|uniref:hypothetical protein n=1 Tax=Tenacibaculum agarivorans TaxID=1908389 RepID=UPI00094BB41C|nr:hypothetical protein [Tenacibaculum agarivorans]
MKTIKLLLGILVSITTLSSCVVANNELPAANFIPTEEIVSGYDLWYVDIHRTQGTADIPFLSKAFTVSFLNGSMYANNNIVDIGRTGDGLGIRVGSYRTFDDGVIETFHTRDGDYSFEVIELSNNEIRLDDLRRNVSYYLVGYQANDFDYDRLFYDNIEFFLQEYIAWERTGTRDGVANPFDDEHFLQFTPENITTFYSSHDSFGTDIDLIQWDFVGGYTIDNITGFDNLKFLTLNYDNGDTEEFELSVLNDGQIELFHLSTKTKYEFTGRGYVQILKGGKNKTSTKPVRNADRIRTKVKRKEITRKVLK